MIAMIDNLCAKAKPLLCPLFALRLGVAWFFYKSALTKVTQVLPWPEISDTTFSLFEDFYQVPLLDPHLAAILGTWAEIILPILLFVGLLTRFTALGLFVFNLVAYFSLPDPNMASIISHLVVYNLMILALVFHGAGRFSLDHLLGISRH